MPFDRRLRHKEDKWLVRGAIAGEALSQGWNSDTHSGAGLGRLWSAELPSVLVNTVLLSHGHAPPLTAPPQHS